tara:strand:+ start:437 stop:727 length:291 start_codon:yes stop_codon:yes gene_type:complete
MLETLMTLRTIKAESDDSISFSIRSNYKDELVLTIGLSTKTEYGTSSTTNFDLLLNDFSEAIASFRADSDNFLDHSHAHTEEIQKFFEATAQLPNN